MKSKGWIGTAIDGASGSRQRDGKRGRLARVLGFRIGLIGCIGALVYSALADAPPVITIAPLGGNQFNITVTNATSPTNYLLEWTPVFADTNYPWLAVATNAPGQTNFAMDASAWPKGFFRVLAGDGDVDGDGIPSWMDAQPFNSSVGVLSVTIDSPLNGSSIY
jgi:hypothetical protein